MPVTAFPLIDRADRPATIFYFDDGRAIFAVPGTPEGVVFAEPGSKAINVVTGVEYQKTTAGSLNTGWTAVATTINQATRLIQSDMTTVGNVGGGLDQLHVTTGGIGSLSLQNDGDFIEMYCSGLYANNANTKRFAFSIAGVGTLLDTGPVATTNRFYQADCRIARVSSVLVRCIARHFVNNNAAVNPISINSVDIAVPDLGANSIFPQTQGESGASVSNDITENFFQVVKYSQGA